MKGKGRGEGVDQKKRTVVQVGEVSCLPGLCVILSALLQRISQMVFEAQVVGKTWRNVYAYCFI